MRVLITGAGGQVGRALAKCAPSSMELYLAECTDLDICDEVSVRARIRDLVPDVIINAAAYTAVDRAESEPEFARRVNADGPRFLAQAAADQGARLLHLSTDFVFDGRSSSPYLPESPTNPLNVYGLTKREGEEAVLDALGARALVLRTSWVYAPAGKNFVRTMLRLMSEHRSVRVVADQVGTPTAAHSIARILWLLVDRPDISGVHHWTDAGVASWYDFAVAIAEDAVSAGLLAPDVSVTPIRTRDYPVAARRPPYSVLDTTSLVEALGVVPVHWRHNLRKVIGDIKSA